MANPFFSGRIPPDLLRHIEEYQEASGESKTEILIQSLAKYTGFNLEETEKPANTPLQERVKMLEEKVNKIEEDLKDQKEDKPVLKLIPPMLSGDNNIFSTKEVCKKLSIGDGQIKHWKQRGHLPKEVNGYTIDFSHKDNNQNYYKVTKSNA